MPDAALTTRETDAPLHASGVNDYDVAAIRDDFPILATKVHGDVPLVYLDNGASAQKPRQVLDAMTRTYETAYSNVHRGLHALSAAATEAFEGARTEVRHLLNAKSDDEIVFGRNATELMNLVAHSWVRAFYQPGDEVVITEMEHHANIVPWLMLREAIGLTVRVIPVDEAGVLDIDALEAAIGPKTRLVAVTHVSNVLGTVNPVERIIRAAHAAGAKVLLDGCQAIVHQPVDVQALGCDFYVFTGHKLYGPSGIGVLYGRKELLERMPPWQGGGDMIRTVSFDKVVFNDVPHKFEAGTPPIVEAIGLAEAIRYVRTVGLDRVARHEHDVLTYATERLSRVEGLRIIGTAPGKAAIVSFTMDSAHPHDIGTIIDRYGVAVRVGHHCAQPLMEKYGIAATTRASFGMYNTRAEVDALGTALDKVNDLFG